MDKALAGEFVMRLFHSRTSSHVHHLTTKSYAEHKALNDYYDAVVDIADSFAEAYQGVYGIAEYPAAGYTIGPDFKTELTGLRAWIGKHRAEITDASELQNIIDEAVGLVDSTLYKLRFLS